LTCFSFARIRFAMVMRRSHELPFLPFKITFTRSRSGNKNDGAHVELKNWTHIRELVGDLRFDAERELNVLNKIWALDMGYANELPLATWPMLQSPRQP
jgi:hypothetical protein